MTPVSNPSLEYLRNAVLTATPEQLQLMLYDGAIRFATRGLEAIRGRDREAAFVALERAQLIVLEMGNGIRREVNPELADRMGAIYNFIYRRLIDANIQHDAEAAEEALRILRYERETWLMLIDKLRKETCTPSTASSSPAPPDDDPAEFQAQA
jgi:flagellar protein FliS